MDSSGVIEEMQPTLMIDEADTALHRNDELRGILNSGYKRKTAYVVRVAMETAKRDNEEMGEENGPEARVRRSRLVRYSSWCPKAIATIKHLPETLQDRCIVIEMHRKKPGEVCERLPELAGTELRRKCARFVRDHAEAIGRLRPGIPVELHDRAAEIWEPLLALADLAQGGWPERARKAAVSLTRSGVEEGAFGALLFDIMIRFARGDRERVFSRDLAWELNAWEDRPWVELKKGKKVTELWLARQLLPYGVRPRTMRIGEEVAKGYFQEDFDEVFRRYIPRKEAKAMLEELTASAESESVAGRGKMPSRQDPIRLGLWVEPLPWCSGLKKKITITHRRIGGRADGDGVCVTLTSPVFGTDKQERLSQKQTEAMELSREKETRCRRWFGWNSAPRLPFSNFSACH